MHVCLADDWEGEPTSSNPNEHGNIQWFDPTTVTDLDLACETYPQLLAHARHWHQTRRPDHSPPGAISRTSFRPDPAVGASCGLNDAQTFSGDGEFERKREAGYLFDAALR